MPHKRNPVVSERICGLARVVRANALVGLENVALWHERDISHSSAERVVVPDSFLALDYMLDRFAWLVEGLEVGPERMLRNLETGHGLFFSQRLLLALVESGLERDDAYRLVQAHAIQAQEEERDFRELVRADEAIAGRVDLDAIFDLGWYTRHVDTVFERLAALTRRRSQSMPEAAVHVGSGKVRELFELDDERLLLVASDRISTFDVVLPTEIPDKGRVLTGLSAFWFTRTRELVPNHLLALRPDGRSSECRRLEMLPLECVVRGYLAGSGWKDYRETGSVCGHELPPGLRESARLPEPIFTPSTKATEGHDENIDRERAAELVGRERFDEVERVSLELYRFASERAAERGVLIADTKFELGVDADGRLVLADEAFTPDSSRFWPAGRVRARASAAVVRQAVRPRLLRDPRLGQDRPRPRASVRHRRRHAGPVRGGLRADHRDPVRRLPRRPRRGTRMKATVLVRPKPGILDPQGETVERSLRQLGFAVEDARVGRVVDLELEDGDPEQARAELERMCEQLLANPLIESYEITVADG